MEAPSEMVFSGSKKRRMTALFAMAGSDRRKALQT
jgi:hypothetical protein